MPLRFLVTVNFMGLYGPASPMPNHFSEEILWAGPDGVTQRDFLDIFHHRLISFVYRAWEKYRHYVQFDPKGPDRATSRIICLLGLGTDGAVPALGSDWLPLLRIAGLLNGRPHSAVGLEGILRELVPQTPIDIEPCVCRRAAIPKAQTIRLGQRACSLGLDGCLGESVEDLAGSFRITLGPLSAEAFRQFLPGREAYLRLMRLVRFYLTDSLMFDLRLRLRSGEVPTLRLCPTEALPLGQMTWLHPDREMMGETILDPAEYDPLRMWGRELPCGTAGEERKQ